MTVTKRCIDDVILALVQDKALLINTVYRFIVNAAQKGHFPKPPPPAGTYPPVGTPPVGLTNVVQGASTELAVKLLSA